MRTSSWACLPEFYEGFARFVRMRGLQPLAVTFAKVLALLVRTSSLAPSLLFCQAAGTLVRTRVPLRERKA